MIQKLAKPEFPKVLVGVVDGDPADPIVQLNIGTLVDKMNEIIEVVNDLDRILSSDAHG